jgi:hypothetical protein
MRRFRPPWTVEQIPGGYKVLDANGQSLAYVYGLRQKPMPTQRVLTTDEARRIAIGRCGAYRYRLRALSL